MTLPPDQQPAEDPLLLNAGPDRVLKFRALGMNLQVETNHDLVEAAARQSFGTFRPERHPTPANFRLRILVHNLPEDAEWTPRQPVMRAQGSQFYIAASRASVISGDTDQGLAFGFISEQQANHEEHLRSAIVQSAFLWMASTRSLSAIHAACIQLNGMTIMLRGRSNAGKTTQAYAALKTGFSLLSEDAAFAWQGPTGLELRAIPSLLYLKPDALRFFPELSHLPIVERFNGERKIAIPLREMFADQIIERADPGPTVFIEQDPEAAYELTLITRQEALRLFGESRIATEYPESNGIKIWDRFLEFPVYRFRVGPDPVMAARALARLCES